MSMDWGTSAEIDCPCPRFRKLLGLTQNQSPLTLFGQQAGRKVDGGQASA